MKKVLFEDRRDFLSRLSVMTLAAPFITTCAVAQKKAPGDLALIKKNANRADCNWCGAKDAPEDISWKAELAEKEEKGERLVLSGTVYMPDGKTPAPDILIYTYHTGTDGIYGHPGEHPHGRFRGWLLTDGQGRYEIRTIKPGAYPSRSTPAHVHYTLTGKTFKEDWIESVLFEGDELITEKVREGLTGKGGFNPILKLEKRADGILYGVRNIQLSKDWV